MPNTKEISKARALLSKENKPNLELGETSFRVYYGTTGATIPFMWESQPGTPKHPMFNKSHDGNDYSAPPLTPPPSYTSSSCLGNTTSKKTRKQKLFDIFFCSISHKDAHVNPTSSLSSSMSWSTSSSSSSSFSSPYFNKKKQKSHRRNISLGCTKEKSPLFGDHENYVDYNHVKSPTSAMCFGLKKTKQGFYSTRVKDTIFPTINSVEDHLIA